MSENAKDGEPLFKSGNPNPEKFGFFSLRWSAGAAPTPERLAEAARLLGRQLSFIDQGGYQCELIAAAKSEAGCIAYVESRAKDTGPHPGGIGGRRIDITIRIHLVEANGLNRSADIESYNPFFGCDVRFFEWVGDAVVLIYREKHWTFSCRFGDVWPPKFVKIEDHWIIHQGQLAFIRRNDEVVHRLSFPDLEGLESISKNEATKLGLWPED